MPLPTKGIDVTITALKIEDAYGTGREIDVAEVWCRNVSVKMHIDQQSLHDLLTGRIGLKAGGLLKVEGSQRVAVELTPLAGTVTLIMEREQVDDLRHECREAMGEIEFGDLKNFGK